MAKEFKAFKNIFPNTAAEAKCMGASRQVNHFWFYINQSRNQNRILTVSIGKTTFASINLDTCTPVAYTKFYNKVLNFVKRY